MITRRELAAALGRRSVADWVIVERKQERASFDQIGPRQRSDHATRWTLIVHHDVPRGRGSAIVEIGASSASALDLVDEVISQAAVAIGPAWRSSPPAAPAKVAVIDPALASTNLLDTSRSVATAIRAPTGATCATSATILREQVFVDAHSGFHAEWTASAIRASALVSAEGHSLIVERQARRLADLSLDVAVRDVTDDLALLASAHPARPGRYSVMLDPAAMLADGDLGVWSVFVDQADSSVERQGLTRYRIGTPIAPGADTAVEPLTITSDGAIDFGLRSAPLSDQGDAVRRFALIEHGLATGVGLAMREAARRHTDPNGGVRNLVVNSGMWPGNPTDPHTLEIRRLRSLAIDRYTGEANLEIALALDHSSKPPRVVVGGSLRIDLVTALAFARRSTTRLHRGAYYGPSAVLIEDAEVMA